MNARVERLPLRVIGIRDARCDVTDIAEIEIRGIWRIQQPLRVSSAACDHVFGSCTTWDGFGKTV
jgi:hypothetical protein